MSVIGSSGAGANSPLPVPGGGLDHLPRKVSGLSLTSRDTIPYALPLRRTQDSTSRLQFAHFLQSACPDAEPVYKSDVFAPTFLFSWIVPMHSRLRE